MASQNVDPRSQVRNSRKEKKKTGISSKDSHSVSKRLNKELMTLMTSGTKGVSAFPEGSNIFKWIGTVEGPKDSVYENLTYRLSLEFPSNYPFSPPKVKFLTPCFHPNVDLVGNICLDILKQKWSAIYSVSSILLSIQSLLEEPNSEDPLNVQAADLWSNKASFKKVLLEHYEKEVRSKVN